MYQSLLAYSPIHQTPSITASFKRQRSVNGIVRASFCTISYYRWEYNIEKREKIEWNACKRLKSIVLY